MHLFVECTGKMRGSVLATCMQRGIRSAWATGTEETDLLPVAKGMWGPRIKEIWTIGGNTWSLGDCSSGNCPPVPPSCLVPSFFCCHPVYSGNGRSPLSCTHWCLFCPPPALLLFSTAVSESKPSPPGCLRVSADSCWTVGETTSPLPKRPACRTLRSCVCVCVCVCDLYF